ncbi:MAG: VOC family protein [Promethearchaeota archaeon]
MSILKLEKFDQIGILVRDIEKAGKLYEGLLHFAAPLNIVEQSSTVTYKEEQVTFKMRKIMQNFGGKQLEIVQLIESTGNHLYKEFLDEGKEGLHHLGFYTKNADKLIEHFEKEFGINVAQTGKAGKVNFYYLDTKITLGFYLELIAF